jgi:hypothetical protein
MPNVEENRRFSNGFVSLKFFTNILGLKPSFKMGSILLLKGKTACYSGGWRVRFLSVFLLEAVFVRGPVPSPALGLMWVSDVRNTAQEGAYMIAVV